MLVPIAPVGANIELSKEESSKVLLGVLEIFTVEGVVVIEEVEGRYNGLDTTFLLLSTS